MSVVRTWMTKNKSDRLHNKDCHLKGQYNMTFCCTKGLSIQTNKRMTNSTSLCEGPIFYFYVFTFMQESKFLLSIPFYFSPLESIMWWGKILAHMSSWIWVAWVIIVDITLEVNMLGGKIISPYLSMCPVETFFSCVFGEC